MARSNLMQECPQLSSKSIEMVCADYLEGLKQARARYACWQCFIEQGASCQHTRALDGAKDLL